MMWVVLFCVACSFPMEVRGEAAEVIVDCSQIEGKFENIAGGMNFWGHEKAQKRFIEEVGTGVFRVKIRLHRVLKGEHGYVNFPWEGDDVTVEDMKILVKNLNLARTKGCRIVIQIYGIPKWLSLSDDEQVVTNDLPNYAKYPPSNYDEWSSLVSASIEELKKLGLKTPNYYEILDEANACAGWYGHMMPCRKKGRLIWECDVNELGHNTVQVMKAFFRVYEASVRGIRMADPDGKIGGFAVIPNPSGIWWTRFFAEYVQSKGLPLDFYSWHWYGVDEAVSSMLKKIGPKELTVNFVRRYFEGKLKKEGFSSLEINRIVVDLYRYLSKLQVLNQQAVRHPYAFVSSQLETILKQTGLASPKLFLTEWNVSNVADRRHDTHYGASFITRGLIDITDSCTEAQSFYVLSNKKRSNYDNGFGGFYGIMTSDGRSVPKASFNAFRLFSMLGDKADRLKVDIQGRDIYAVATKKNDNVSLLFTYYLMAKRPDHNMSKDIDIHVKDIGFTRYAYNLYLIDGNHSNSYTGSGPEVEKIESRAGTGNLKIKKSLPVYGVLMLKIHPTQEPK